SAPSRNSRRRRISPERAASLNEVAVLLAVVVAMPVLCACLSLGLDLAARGLDRRARTLGDADALERHRLLDLTREHHLGALRAGRHHARLEEHRQVDDAVELGELGQAHLGARALHGRAEADLGHPALQRHLAALEADLVVAALAGALALGAAAAGLALAGGGATADAQARTPRSRCWFECVQSHRFQAPSSTRSRCTAAAIMPRFSRVSLTVTVWRMRRRPRP